MYIRYGVKLPEPEGKGRKLALDPALEAKATHENSHYEMESDHQIAQSKLAIRHPRKTAEKLTNPHNCRAGEGPRSCAGTRASVFSDCGVE